MVTIRIATYNLWASDHLFAERLDAACDELCRIAPDVIGLQEVRHDIPGDTSGIAAASRIGDRTGLSHLMTSLPAPGEADGPALLGRQALREIAFPPGGEQVLAGYAQRAVGAIANTNLAITDVHLDWRSIAARERQIVAIIDWIAATGEPDRHEVLLGGFNCRPESSVYRFLMGQQTIGGRDTMP